MRSLNFSPDEFDALHTEVEEQGGALTGDLCMPQDVKYTEPPYAVNRLDKNITCGCGFMSIIALPYDGERGKPGFVRACAICDGTKEWPRLRDAVLEAEDDDDE